MRETRVNFIPNMELINTHVFLGIINIYNMWLMRNSTFPRGLHFVQRFDYLTV